MEADLRVGGVEDVVVVLHAGEAGWNWSLQLLNKLFNRYYGNSGNENNKNVPTPVEERPALVEEEANC